MMKQKPMRTWLLGSIALNFLLITVVAFLLATRGEKATGDSESLADAGSGNAASSNQRPGSSGASSERNRSTKSASSRSESQGARKERRRVIKKLDDFLKNPGMQREIAKQQRLILDQKYADLVARYELNDEEASYFIDLLTARQMKYVEFGMKQMTGTLEGEEYERLVNEMKTGVAEIHEQIGEFLNNEEDAEFLAYFDRTEVERSALSDFEAGGSEFSAEETEGLIAVLVDAQEQTTLGQRALDPEQAAQFTEEQITQYQQELSELGPRVSEQSSTILEPGQLESWKEAYSGYVQRRADWLRMIRRMSQPAGGSTGE